MSFCRAEVRKRRLLHRSTSFLGLSTQLSRGRFGQRSNWPFESGEQVDATYIRRSYKTCRWPRMAGTALPFSKATFRIVRRPRHRRENLGSYSNDRSQRNRTLPVATATGSHVPDSVIPTYRRRSECTTASDELIWVREWPQC
jgi:hypothetical protein